LNNSSVPFAVALSPLPSVSVNDAENTEGDGYVWVTVGFEVFFDLPSPKVHAYETTGAGNPEASATNVTVRAPAAGLIEKPAFGATLAPAEPALTETVARRTAATDANCANPRSPTGM
jgi:hypothetical protein